jgi:hypothetical protein
MQKPEKCRAFIGGLYLDGYVIKFCYIVKIIKKDSFQMEKTVIFSFRKEENILEIRFTFIEKI